MNFFPLPLIEINTLDYDNCLKKRKKESEVAQSCLTVCNPMDCGLPRSSVHGISRQEYWGGLPFLSPGDLTYPRLNLMSCIAGRLFTD